jgi:hypothetical protein
VAGTSEFIWKLVLANEQEEEKRDLYSSCAGLTFEKGPKLWREKRSLTTDK